MAIQWSRNILTGYEIVHECNGEIVLGKAVASGSHLQRTYTQLPPHTMIYLDISLFSVDCNLYLLIDDVGVQQFTIRTTPMMTQSDVCSESASDNGL